jgi:2'-5' RNA ligase
VDEKSHFRYAFAMAETAVVVLLPELEPLIGGWRLRYTGDGARGMPPHVTLIIPFADSADLGDRLGPLGRALGAFAAFEVTLARAARFPGIVYLRPEPNEPFVAMTEALVAVFPEFPPYGGEFQKIVPHVTVAQADDAVLASLERELVPKLPVRARVERAWLVENTPSGWRRHTAFPLDRHTRV